MRPIEVIVPDELDRRWEQYLREAEGYGASEEPTVSDKADLQEKADAVAAYVDELVKAALIYKAHVGRNMEWIRLSPKKEKGDE